MDQLHQNHTGYAFLMLFAGMGIPVMAALNAGLGAKLQSPALAATILFLVGLIGSVIFLLVFEGTPTGGLNKEIPSYFYLGGLIQGNKAEEAPSHHTPEFMIDDDGLIYGVKAMIQLSLDYLNGI